MYTKQYNCVKATTMKSMIIYCDQLVRLLDTTTSISVTAHYFSYTFLCTIVCTSSELLTELHLHHILHYLGQYKQDSYIDVYIVNGDDKLFP